MRKIRLYILLLASINCTFSADCTLCLSDFVPLRAEVRSQLKVFWWKLGAIQEALPEL